MKSLAALVALATALAVPANAVAVWGQCGGIGFSGSTVCDAGTTCIKLNDYYSQCQPGAAAPPPPVTTTPASPPPSQTGAPKPAATGLDKAFKAKGKVFFGTAADSNRFNNPTDSAVTIREFGGLTPENSMKWDATESTRNQFNFAGSDALVNYATQNGMLVRAHTLVWHSQLPGWVSQINDRATLTSVIQNHIKNLAGRYAGKVRSWDVVNEMFNEDGTVRSSVFSNVLGTSFVQIAFEAARQADPNAILYINDYNLDSVNAKLNGLVNLVNQVNSGTQLIDGIGTQMHLSQGGAGGALSALQKLASAKVDEVAITELDIVNASPNDYSTVAKACLQVPKCVSITVWGVRDPDSWRASSNPLLFDGNFNPKPAYTAVMQALA
ncbi:glycoside hydrolase superfamily [Earliella scabrosa]|nr:glycoside hydrolase superfamily [Earliella scabrosa]